MPPSPRLAHLMIAAVLGAAACAGSPPDPTATEPSSVPDPAAVDRSADPASTGPADEPSPAEAPAATATASQTPTAEPVPTATAAPTPTGPPASSPTAPPDPEPTAMPAVAPTTGPGQPCVAGLAGDPVVTTTARADIDGDGATDQVTAYAVNDGGRTWFIRVDTAAGESLDSPLTGGIADETVVTPIGGADVDGDGATQELFTVVGAGAATTIVAIHARIGCELVQVTIDSTAATFPVGGSVVNLGGLQCLGTDEDGVNTTIVAWTGVADLEAAAGTYDVTGVEYRLTGTELVEVGRRAVRANLAEADFTYAQLSCDGLSL